MGATRRPNAEALWDVAETGQNELYPPWDTRESVDSVAFSPKREMDCRAMVSERGTTLKNLGRRNRPQRKSAALRGHYGRSVCGRGVFSPNGKRIVSGGPYGMLKVWDAETGREIRTLRGHTRGVVSVAFSPEGGRIVSASFDGTVKIWDAETGKEKLTLLDTRTLRGGASPVSSVAFSPDGRRIVSGDLDGILKVWDAETGQNELSVLGHTNSVTSVAFSPYGKTIVSASLDETLKIWDAGTGRQIRAFRGHTRGVSGVAFSPNGQRIVSGSGDRHADRSGTWRNAARKHPLFRGGLFAVEPAWLSAPTASGSPCGGGPDGIPKV